MKKALCLVVAPSGIHQYGCDLPPAFFNAEVPEGDGSLRVVCLALGTF